jgi:hypothetical protein
MAALGAVGEPSGGFSASHRCKLENSPWVRPAA